MKIRIYLQAMALVLAVTGPVDARQRQPNASAAGVLQQAIDAQGGENSLRAITTLSFTAQGYRNMLEQSERPEGPYIVEYESITEFHDQASGRFSSLVESTVPPSYVYSQTIVADPDAAMRLVNTTPAAGDADMRAAAHEALALSPERLLLTARSARDATLAAPATMHGILHDVVTFSLDGAQAKLFVNRYTHLPTALDYAGPLARTGYWQRLGDVSMRTIFSGWALGADGLRLPMQWDIYRNGQHDGTYAIRSLRLNAKADEAALTIPADIRAAFRSAARIGPVLGRPGKPPVEIAQGVTLIPGSWNVTIVRQADGVVIVEAPISPAYSELVIAEAARRYPGVPIKAVVTTSDSWPHISGLRAYVARGIPIYGLDLNQPIVRRLADMAFSTKPDAQQRRRVALHFVPVSERTFLGRGPNRLELYPMRGASTERQMMVYWPGHHILYGSDPFQSLNSGAEQMQELADAAQRHGLSPASFFMMHIGLTPWADLKHALADPKNLQFSTTPNAN